jgi:hypothetical protein
MAQNPDQINGQPPDALATPPSLAAKSVAPPPIRIPFDPKAIFAAFLERVPAPPSRLDTPESISSLKLKGMELRTRLAALETLKGTPAWTPDQEAKYYFMDFQRKWIFCRCLRINQLVSTGHHHPLRPVLTLAIAHRSSPPDFPPRLLVVY